MQTLTLTWLESGQAQIFTLRPPSDDQPRLYRIGRDPSRCDLVLSDPTVSGLHVEIFWQPIASQFYLRNLRDRNPPVINNQPLMNGEIALTPGSTILLGNQLLSVQAIAPLASPLVPTMLLTPEALQPQLTPPSSSGPSYGLMCPKCHQISAYERLTAGCLWCGTSLAAAASVLFSPAPSAIDSSV